MTKLTKVEKINVKSEAVPVGDTYEGHLLFDIEPGKSLIFISGNHRITTSSVVSVSEEDGIKYVLTLNSLYKVE